MGATSASKRAWVGESGAAQGVPCSSAAVMAGSIGTRPACCHTQHRAAAHTQEGALQRGCQLLAAARRKHVGALLYRRDGA